MDIEVNVNDETTVTIELGPDCVQTMNDRAFKGTDLDGKITAEDVGYLIQGFMSQLVNFENELPTDKTAFQVGQNLVKL